MDTFGDRVYTLTNQVYPYLVKAPTVFQSLAVPAFFKRQKRGTRGHEVPRSKVYPGSSGNSNTHPKRVTHVW